MNSPLLQLSQEVIDQIVDFLDQESLAHCALTHPVFVYRSQSRLFSTIYLSSDRYGWGDKYGHRYKRINAFLEMLHVSPHIARYVRGLSLQISSFDNSWIVEEPIFIEFLEILKRTGSRMETLHLIGMSFPEKLSDARLFEQNFLKPFISSSLTTLVISGILDIPISLITNSPNLRNIKTFRSSLEPFGDNIDDALLHCSPKVRNLHYTPPDATIESLLVDNMVSSNRKNNLNLSDLSPRLYASVFVESMTQYHFDLPPIADLAQLRSITTTTQDPNILQNIIQVSRNSLEELCLLERDLHPDENIEYRGGHTAAAGLPLADYLDLSEVCHLRALSMDVVFPGPTRCSPLDDICKILKTIPTKNRLEDITLNFFFGFESSSSDIESALKVDWGGLDSEITRMACQKPFHLFFKTVFHMQDSDYWGSGSDDELIDTSDLDKEKQKLCGDILRRLPKESFPRINAVSSISLDYTYSIVTD